MKTIALPLIVVLALVFVSLTSAPAQAYSPYYSGYTGQQPHTRAQSPSVGPFYPYPQVPLGWRGTAQQWDDGWWFLDFTEFSD
jgi:hypothetical protein